MPDQFGNLSPEDFAQQQAINRQQRLATMLMQNTAQPQGQMVSGRYVAPSFFQNILPLVNAYVGKSMLEEGDTQQMKLAEAIRNKGSQDLQEMFKAAKGTPAQQAGIYGADGKITQATTADMYDANLQLNPQYQQKEAIAGQAPNPMAAILKGSSSYNPMARQYASTLLAQITKPPEKFNLRENESRFVENEDGTATEIATGKVKERVATSVNLAAAERLGFPPNPDLWTPEQRAAIDLEVGKKIKAGAPITTNINSVMGKSLADIQPILKDSMVAAQGAIQSNDNVDKIIKAASDKGFYGPGANIQMFGAQLADKAGYGGKDTQTKLKNTRDAIQGLAQLVLQGRKQMRGEGAIAQAESLLAEKATSGEIDKLTASEIIQLAKAAQRVNNYTIASHEQKIKLAKSTPETALAAPYYEVPYYGSSSVEYLGPVKPKP